MSDPTPELRVVSATGEEDVRATLDLVAHARRSLAEARTLPDIRRVMEAATVAADAAKRVAKLAEAERRVAEVVEAANEAANDAAAVRIEAQAKAGELLQAMAECGERDRGGRGRIESRPATQLRDLGVSKSESSRWQQVAGVPVEDRTEYVEETKAAGGEVSTDGLLRRASAAGHGRSGASRAVDHAAIASEARKQVRRLYRELLTLPGYRPASLVDALDNGERKNLLRALDQLSTWIEDVKGELAARRPREEE